MITIERGTATGEGTGEAAGEGVVEKRRAWSMILSKERERKPEGEEGRLLKSECSEVANSRMILANRLIRMIARMTTNTALMAMTNADVAIWSGLTGKLPVTRIN